ncbi:MAG: PHP domain-containing protein [Spirochaetales bacterium]|nr:PHP domain-containing protein [Spirochaetales bacterium]MCF7937291.1 PHP domain-containing protein [Spirochaetales bacterium]
MIDLHTHSTASDGTFAPGDLVRYAWKQGVHAIAVTDHDTLAGLEEAIKAADSLPIRVLPGIELEIMYEGGEFHLLGLGLKYWKEVAGELLAPLLERRTVRNRQIIEKMQEAGLEVEYDDIRRLAGGTIVARPHFARYLVESGFVSSMEEAFTSYLGVGRPFYVERETMGLAEGLHFIHEAGGKAVLAHPKTLHLKIDTLESKLREWKAIGLDGIESLHSNARPAECRRFSDLAGRLELFISAGSDFHGTHRPDRRIGHSCHGRPIDDTYLLPFID